jgi:hypothetical protein
MTISKSGSYSTRQHHRYNTSPHHNHETTTFNQICANRTPTATVHANRSPPQTKSDTKLYLSPSPTNHGVPPCSGRGKRWNRWCGVVTRRTTTSKRLHWKIWEIWINREEGDGKMLVRSQRSFLHKLMMTNELVSIIFSPSLPSMMVGILMKDISGGWWWGIMVGCWW